MFDKVGDKAVANRLETTKYVNALTVDVEDGWSIFSRDWLHKQISPTEAVVKDTEWLLNLLEGKNVKATFFVLGDVAQKFPSLIRRIADDKHEIGAHGFSHKQIFKLTKREFRSEVADVKKMLEDIISAPVAGYRAPAFSVTPKTSWALEVLAEEGFVYDSSIVPCKNSRYGWPGFCRDICRVDLHGGRSIIEVPMTIVSFPVIGKGFVTGGGYIRHFPYCLLSFMIKLVRKHRPVVIYMHPYEFGINIYPLSFSHLSKEKKKRALRHLKFAARNRKYMPCKLRKLLSEFEFSTIGRLIETAKSCPSGINSVKLDKTENE
jgi:polysaccharide deacetylase family protein (PEP-CTERM system associated)